MHSLCAASAFLYLYYAFHGHYGHSRSRRWASSRRGEAPLCIYIYIIVNVSLRQAKVVDDDPRSNYNYSTTNNRSIRSWLMNLLKLLAPNGWRLPASRPPANNGVPVVGASTPCGPISPGEITDFVPDELESLIYGRRFVPGMGSYTPREPVASRTPANQLLKVVDMEGFLIRGW